MKNKLFLFIVGLVALLAFQYKYVMPIIYDVVSSDLFLETSSDEKNRKSSTNSMTDTAYKHCNYHIANELLADYSLTFSEQPINAFGLGNYEYVINADVNILPADAASFTKRYVCRIKYDNKDDESGLTDFENWSINGLSGLDDIS